jgi:hypothetical protein
MPVREKATIEFENSAYFGPALGFASLDALKPASQVLQDNKGGKVEGDQRGGPDGEVSPDRFEQIGAFGRGIRIENHSNAAGLNIKFDISYLGQLASKPCVDGLLVCGSRGRTSALSKTLRNVP